MGRFISPEGVTFAVADNKDHRYEGIEGYTAIPAPKPVKAAPSKSEKSE